MTEISADEARRSAYAMRSAAVQRFKEKWRKERRCFWRHLGHDWIGETTKLPGHSPWYNLRCRRCGRYEPLFTRP